MKTPERDWQPDPQLLAAYFDGELEGCPDLADLRARLETWLELHPEVLAEANENKRLGDVVLETAPAEPNADAWAKTLACIEETRKNPPRRTAPYRWTAVVGVASILLLLGLILGIARYPVTQRVTTDVAFEVLEVAAANEIVILRIEGADTSLLVVGSPPLNGPLELADAGDIRVFNLQPDALDNMVPRVRQNGAKRPMIWAPTEAEEE